MEAKEKANELVVSFYTIIPENSNEYGMEWGMAKECAMIAVDEVIKAGSQEIVSYYFDDNYWNEVKKELEKL